MARKRLCQCPGCFERVKKKKDTYCKYHLRHGCPEDQRLEEDVVISLENGFRLKEIDYADPDPEEYRLQIELIRKGHYKY